MGEFLSGALYFVLNNLCTFASTSYFPKVPICIIVFGEPEFENEV